MNDWQTEQIDPKTLSDAEIRAAVREHCQKMGSFAYYEADELDWIKREPAGLRVFRAVYGDGTKGPLRAYHTRGRAR
jgi:hypothetical protein